MLYIFYIFLISIDLAQYEIFRAEACDFWQSWDKSHDYNMGKEDVSQYAVKVSLPDRCFIS